MLNDTSYQNVKYFFKTEVDHLGQVTWLETVKISRGIWINNAMNLI